MAKKKGTPPTPPSKKAPTTPAESMCETCQRGCKNLLMVVQGCGRYLPK